MFIQLIIKFPFYTSAGEAESWSLCSTVVVKVGESLKGTEGPNQQPCCKFTVNASKFTESLLFFFLIQSLEGIISGLLIFQVVMSYSFLTRSNSSMMKESYSSEKYRFTAEYQSVYSYSYHDNGPRTYPDQSPYWNQYDSLSLGSDLHYNSLGQGYQSDCLPPCNEEEELSTSTHCKCLDRKCEN